MISHSPLIWRKGVRVHFIFLVKLIVITLTMAFWSVMFGAVHLPHFVSNGVFVLKRGVTRMTSLCLVHDKVTACTTDSPRARMIRVSRVVGKISSEANRLFNWRAATSTQIMVIRVLRGALSLRCDA